MPLYMKAYMNTTIKATATMSAINNMVLSSTSYDAALTVVRTAYAGAKISRKDAAIALAMAYVHHNAKAYAGQRDAETGKAVRCSALEQRVNRDLSAITRSEGGKAKSHDAIAVPKAIAAAAAALWALCAEYEGAGRLASVAVATARSDAKV